MKEELYVTDKVSRFEYIVNDKILFIYTKQKGSDKVAKEVKIKRIHEVEKRLRDTQKMLSDDLLSAYKEKDLNKAEMVDKYLTSVNEIINACESRGRF